MAVSIVLSDGDCHGGEQVYGWMPEPFSNDSLQDPQNEFAQTAQTLLGPRLNPDYIGVTCEGEVGCLCTVTQCVIVHMKLTKAFSCCFKQIY